jgi:exoribonuclease II
MLTNLPPPPKPSTSASQAFNDYYQFPLQINASVFSSIRGFFESKGFDKLSAESISVTIIRQCLQDNINPMTTLDGLSHLDGADLSALATQILNYNRFKSSYLGIGTTVTPHQQIQRNILA